MVESMLKAAFCAVPAAMRVEPARTSGPESRNTAISAWANSGAEALQAIATVAAPVLRAASSPASV